jgi:alkanesulfonate monooxygenase SsuD/methylene tetrahydromethanopterin reductase-like flavin-dependent oxidoreductase (luciferase family)
MQFGFRAPVAGPLSGARDLARIVSSGEAMGYDYCTISDHVIRPRDMEKKYPYTDTGELPQPQRAGGDLHEQLTCAAFIAAKTEKLRLVTSVTVVPHRPPVLTAKIIATIDVLSEGRFTWGIGVGWCREEFEAIGTEPFPERGAVTDETIAVCRELWSNEDPSFNGKYAKFSNVFFQPRPVQGADLGRRRERPGDAPDCHARRRLVPDRHQPAEPARHAGAVARWLRAHPHSGARRRPQPVGCQSRLSVLAKRPRNPGEG